MANYVCKLPFKSLKNLFRATLLILGNRFCQVPVKGIDKLPGITVELSFRVALKLSFRISEYQRLFGQNSGPLSIFLSFGNLSAASASPMILCQMVCKTKKYLGVFYTFFINFSFNISIFVFQKKIKFDIPIQQINFVYFSFFIKHLNLIFSYNK